MTSIVIDRQHQIVGHILSRKGPCRAATTANITLSGVQTIDGVAVVADDRVLVKDQTNGLNGIYVCKTGEWELATDFNHADFVLKGSKVFVTSGTLYAMTDWHVLSDDNTRPGRETITFGQLTNAAAASIVFVIDGGGSEIADGIHGDLEVPFACTITQATALADSTGSLVVDIWKDSYANFPPTDADSITASAPVTISSAAKSQDSTLTGWTTSLAAGDILRFNVDSCTTIVRAAISLRVARA